MADISDRHVQAFRKFLESLPHGKDIELVLLKGHLLIEEQVRMIVHRRLRNPDVFEEANSQLETHQAIQLAKAFFPPDHMPEIWKATLKLNKLRNDIAHNLWSKASLSDKVAAWVQLVPSTLTTGPDQQQNFELAAMVTLRSHIVTRRSTISRTGALAPAHECGLTTRSS